jgi:hypothetical protein
LKHEIKLVNVLEKQLEDWGTELVGREAHNVHERNGGPPKVERF